LQFGRPLHLAARQGMVAVTKTLLSRGASVEAVDNSGLTPALACAPGPHVAQCLAIILASYPSAPSIPKNLSTSYFAKIYLNFFFFFFFLFILHKNIVSLCFVLLKRNF
jgi:ankyrin repeat protein